MRCAWCAADRSDETPVPGSMPRVPDIVQRKLDALPDQPGVYLWKGRGGEVLYVGKAKRLRQRVRSYCTTDYNDSPKHRMLLRQIDDLETIVVPSEAQALLLENNLIKEHGPRYNIQLRDDKSYPYIAVTLGDPFPRVLVVRRVRIPGARYFGPYTDVGKLRRTLRIIRRIFTVRSCHYDLPTDAPERPCLDYHIHRCLAPCVGYQARADYRSMIDDVLAFLEGKTVEVRTRLRERMESAAARLDFERAAELRNSLRWLEQLEDAPAVEQVGGGDADVVGYARDGDDAVGVVLRVRNGKVVAREQQFLHNLAEEPDEAVLSAFLVRSFLPLDARARRAVLPLVPQDLEDLTALAPETEWLVPQRGRLRRLADLADRTHATCSRASASSPSRRTSAPKIPSTPSAGTWASRRSRAASSVWTSPRARAATPSAASCGSRRAARRRVSTGGSGFAGMEEMTRGSRRR